MVYSNYQDQVSLPHCSSSTTDHYTTTTTTTTITATNLSISHPSLHCSWPIFQQHTNTRKQYYIIKCKCRLVLVLLSPPRTALLILLPSSSAPSCNPNPNSCASSLFMSYIPAAFNKNATASTVSLSTIGSCSGINIITATIRLYLIIGIFYLFLNPSHNYSILKVLQQK